MSLDKEGNMPLTERLHETKAVHAHHSMSVPPRTDSKYKMPTKLCPRKSGTVFGPNAMVRRAQRDAEANQYLR